MVLLKDDVVNVLTHFLLIEYHFKSIKPFAVACMSLRALCSMIVPFKHRALKCLNWHKLLQAI